MSDIRRTDIVRSIDWVTVALFVLLTLFGWFTVCGASYSFDHPDLFDFATRSGKQLVWIGCAYVLGFVLMMLDSKTYEGMAAYIYIAVMALLLATIFLADDIKGSRSWLSLGPVNVQPAEFAKFATSLMLAKLMGAYGFDLGRWGNLAQVLLVIFVPVALIVGQNETGSALVFFALFVMLYREGLPGAIPFTGVAMVVYFVVSIKYDQSMMAGGLTPKGSFAVLCLILVFTLSMMRMYLRRDKRLRPVAVICLVAVSASVAVSRWVVPFDVTCAVVVLVVGLALYNFYRWLVTGVARSAWIGLFALMSVGFLYSSGYVFREVLQDHQRVRIEVLLGMVEDPTGVGYNVNQSKIAIGSGGMTGKGFLNGTQTKLKYVPEQDTDFIFCTVGEEQGFVGAAGVLLVYLAFILRLIHLAERQDRDFARIYGYCVASIFLFHVFVNVGMVLGLVPVIGIPLPFFSYGGSSLWGFTILLFVFLRLDAGRGSMA